MKRFITFIDEDGDEVVVAVDKIIACYENTEESSGNVFRIEVAGTNCWNIQKHSYEKIKQELMELNKETEEQITKRNINNPISDLDVSGE